MYPRLNPNYNDTHDAEGRIMATKAKIREVLLDVTSEEKEVIGRGIGREISRDLESAFGKLYEVPVDVVGKSLAGRIMSIPGLSNSNITVEELVELLNPQIEYLTRHFSAAYGPDEAKIRKQIIKGMKEQVRRMQDITKEWFKGSKIWELVEALERQ